MGVLPHSIPSKDFSRRPLELSICNRYLNSLVKVLLSSLGLSDSCAPLDYLPQSDGAFRCAIEFRRLLIILGIRARGPATNTSAHAPRWTTRQSPAGLFRGNAQASVRVMPIVTMEVSDQSNRDFATGWK